jgi:hypothetical protein
MKGNAVTTGYSASTGRQCLWREDAKRTRFRRLPMLAKGTQKRIKYPAIHVIWTIAVFAGAIPGIAQMRPIDAEMSPETKQSIVTAQSFKGQLTQDQENKIIEALALVNNETNETAMQTSKLEAQLNLGFDRSATQLGAELSALDQKSKILDRTTFELTGQLTNAGMSADSISRAVRAAQALLRAKGASDARKAIAIGGATISHPQVRPVGTDISPETEESIVAAKALSDHLTQDEKTIVFDALARVTSERKETELEYLKVQTELDRNRDAVSSKDLNIELTLIIKKAKDLDRAKDDLRDELSKAGIRQDDISRGAKAAEKVLAENARKNKKAGIPAPLSTYHAPPPEITSGSDGLPAIRNLGSSPKAKRETDDLAGPTRDLPIFIMNTASAQNVSKLPSYLDYLASAVPDFAARKGTPGVMDLLVNVASSRLTNRSLLRPYLEILLLREIIIASPPPASEVPAGYGETVLRILRESGPALKDWNSHHPTFSPSVDFMRMGLIPAPVILRETVEKISAADLRNSHPWEENESQGWILFYLEGYSALAVGNQTSLDDAGSLTAVGDLFLLSKSPTFLTDVMVFIFARAAALRQLPVTELRAWTDIRNALLGTSGEVQSIAIRTLAGRINHAQGIPSELASVREFLGGVIADDNLFKSLMLMLFAAERTSVDSVDQASATLILTQFRLPEGQARELVSAFVQERFAVGFRNRDALAIWAVIGYIFVQHVGMAGDPFDAAYTGIFTTLTGFAVPAGFDGINRAKAVLTMAGNISVEDLSDPRISTGIASFMLNEAITSSEDIYQKTVALLLKPASKGFRMPASAGNLIEAASKLNVSEGVRNHPGLSSRDLARRKQDMFNLYYDNSKWELPGTSETKKNPLRAP